MIASTTPRPFNAEVKDLRGQKFGRLTVTGFCRELNRAKWICRCSCPDKTEVKVYGFFLKSGHVKSCGCFQRDAVRTANTTHGGTGDKLHDVWKAIKQRVLNPNHRHYHNYGGRGIKLHEAWINDYAAFRGYILETLKERPSGEYSLDRIKTDGHYEPGNLKWSTQKEQCRNTRRNRLFEYQGKLCTVAEISEKLGFKRSLIFWRLKNGWTFEEAIATPVGHKKTTQP